MGFGVKGIAETDTFFANFSLQTPPPPSFAWKTKAGEVSVTDCLIGTQSPL